MPSLPAHRSPCAAALGCAALAGALFALPGTSLAQTLATGGPAAPATAVTVVHAPTASASPAPVAVATTPPEFDVLRRVEVSYVGGGGLIFGSRYTAVAGALGYDDVIGFGAAALEVGANVNPYLLLGARGGYAGGDLHRTRPRNTATIGVGIFDASAIARLELPFSHDPRERGVLGLQLEGGVATATLWNQDGAAWSPVIPRFAASIVLQAQSRFFGGSLRAGVQHMVWPNAGGQGIDLGLTGLFFTAGLEVGR